MPLRAAFPWYDLAGVQQANDVLWLDLRMRLERRGMVGLPAALERHSEPATSWRDPNLLISQMCGLDLWYVPRVAVVATPVFDLPDCPPGHYFSYIVRRVGDSAAPQCAAINSRRSHSGGSMLLRHVQPPSLLETGSHAASLQALQTGAADVAAIDAVTWHILEHTRPPLLDGLQRVGRSACHPAPPWITCADANHRPALRAALRETLGADATRAARRALLLRGATRLPTGAYAHLPALRTATSSRAAAT